MKKIYASKFAVSSTSQEVWPKAFQLFLLFNLNFTIPKMPSGKVDQVPKLSQNSNLHRNVTAVLRERSKKGLNFMTLCQLIHDDRTGLYSPARKAQTCKLNFLGTKQKYRCQSLQKWEANNFPIHSSFAVLE